MQNPIPTPLGLPIPTADEARAALARILASVPERVFDVVDQQAAVVARYIVATAPNAQQAQER